MTPDPKDPIDLGLDDDDDHTSVSPPPDFLPRDRASTVPEVGISLDDDDDDRTVIDKRPGPR